MKQKFVFILFICYVNLLFQNFVYGTEIIHIIEKNYDKILSDEKTIALDDKIMTILEKEEKTLPPLLLQHKYSEYDNNSVLHSAIHLGLNNFALRLITEGININVKNDQDFDPFLYAAWYGRDQVIQSLLKKGVDPKEIGGKRKSTAYHLSAENNHSSTLNILLEVNKEYANSLDSRKQTPMMRAAARGYLSIIELLLSKDADPCLRDLDQRMAADYAHLTKHKDIEKLLEAKCK